MKEKAKKSKGGAKTVKMTLSSRTKASSPDLPDWLEDGLQDIYKETLDEPLPKDLLDLLEELEKAEKKS